MPLDRRRLGLLVAGFLAVAVLGLGLYWRYGGPTTSVYIDYRDAEKVALGEEIYTAQCAACHGADLEGQPNWRERGEDGRLPAPPHDQSGHTWHHGDQQLFELTKYGTAAIVGGSYESDMPGYENDLSDREILAVLAFIKSSWPREVRDRHDEINQRARELYQGE
jgi:mono/diheme cytochrome c family protein